MDQVAVDRPDERLPRGQLLRQPGHIPHEPLDLGGREIRIEAKTGSREDHRLASGRLLGLAARIAPAALPDDRGTDRDSGGSIPYHDGFALVGDADGIDLGG